MLGLQSLSLWNPPAVWETPATNDLLLEDSSGHLTLEDGSGVLVLES